VNKKDWAAVERLKKQVITKILSCFLIDLTSANRLRAAVVEFKSKQTMHVLINNLRYLQIAEETGRWF